MPDFSALPPLTLALIGVAMLAAGFAHGVIGFGFPVVATPLVALAALFVGHRIHDRVSAATYARWLRGFLWLMVGLLVLHFARQQWAQ